MGRRYFELMAEAQARHGESCALLAEAAAVDESLPATLRASLIAEHRANSEFYGGLATEYRRMAQEASAP